MSGYEHQDWEPVVIRSKENYKQQHIQKQNAAGTKKYNELNKDDIPILDKISNEQKQNLIQGRTAKGLTRKQFASMLNIQESIIAEYENGTVKVFNKGIYNRMLKALGIKTK